MRNFVVKLLVVIMCVVSLVPEYVFGVEARDQDKENMVSEKDSDSTVRVDSDIEDDSIQDDSNDNDDDNDLKLASEAKSAIMIEASSGKVIYEKNADEGMPMASMTNIMTI